MNNKYNIFTDFLKDEKFILWQLLPDNKSDEYWGSFIKNNPHLILEINKASAFLKTTGLNKSHLTTNEKSDLLDRLLKSFTQSRKKKLISRVIQYASVACVIIAFTIGFSLNSFKEKSLGIQENSEQIVGHLLNNKDIKLISGENTLLFSKDVQVELDKDGKALISQKNESAKSIEISNTSLNKLIVPYGKRSSIVLSDGSKVWLNSGSILEFPATFKGKTREIVLAQGEMYIEVAHDVKKRFQVHTSVFDVNIYGTKFNISTYNDSPKSIVLAEGRVSLKSFKGDEFFLSPNQQAIYSESGKFITKKVDASQYTSWKNGYLTFDKTPMPEVLRQIGRYYNLDFNYENDINLQKRTCSGKIYLSENLDNVMTTIGLLTSTKFINVNNKISITNESNQN